MALLVSGASGFLGSRLVQRLVAKGYDVVAVTRHAIPPLLTSHQKIRWLVCDLSKDSIAVNDLPEITAVFHLAAAKDSTDAGNFLLSNEMTTVRLLQAFAPTVKRFIFTSSQMVYGNPSSTCVTEEFPLQADGSAYGCSKINSENWLRLFQQQYGGVYLCLRYCGFVEGGGLVDYIFDRAILGETIELYSQGKVHRDYLLVENGVDALIASLDFKCSDGFLPINIGSGQVVSTLEITKMICSELNSSSQIELLLDPSPRSDFIFCVDRAKEFLNFHPNELMSSIKKYVRYREMCLINKGFSLDKN
jgi:UDP-glucose 4-epimerase